MKADEFLSQASRELRDEGEAPPSEVASTRARIMTTMRKEAHRPRRVAFWVMPIAAVLAASTALATSRAEIRRVWHQLMGDAPLVQPLANETNRAPRSVSRDVPHPDPTAALPIAPTVVEDPVLEDPVAEAPLAKAPAEDPSPNVAAPSSSRGARTPKPTTTFADEPRSVNTPPSPEPSAESEALPLELYKRAHRLHFQQQRYSEAIDAWNNYLRAQPNGSLAVEASYNLALALLRAGRRDEARAALAPFARGEISGGYRAEEARSLLSALEGAPR